MESADFINYFSSLESTGAVACYIEGFKNGRTLQLAADAAARRKVPIVAVKVGRTDEGTSMAKAHTGHLTGSDDVVSAVFRQYGVQRVDGLDQLLEVVGRPRPHQGARRRRHAAPDPRRRRARLRLLHLGRHRGPHGRHGRGGRPRAALADQGLADSSCTNGSRPTCGCRTPWTTVAPRCATGGVPRSSRRCSPTPTSTCCCAPSPAPCPSMANKLCEDLVDGGGHDGQAHLRGLGLPRRHRGGLHEDAAREHRAHLPHLHQRGHGGEGLLRPSPLRRLLRSRPSRTRPSARARPGRRRSRS